MKPVMQSIVDPVNGDCLRACIASIFELPLEEVPHFVALGTGWHAALQNWLRPMGLVMQSYPYRGAVDVPAWWPSGWWIASVESEVYPGGSHAVVMRGTETIDDVEDWMAVAHDPSPHPRRTPYKFREAKFFVALDPALIAAHAQTVRALESMP
jgi:hypothetical protein